jgi:hypothetical protein
MFYKTSLLLFCIIFPLFVISQTPGIPQGGAKCNSDYDCSLGGVCNSSQLCSCDAWFTGESCNLLNLAPATPGAGLQVQNYFSWGGHSLDDGKGTFHLFASFMCRHATLGDWTTKSSIWRATSTSPEGPFSLVDMIAQPWSHNAMVSATKGGNESTPSYVLYQIGDAVTDPSEWQPCYNASETDLSFTPTSSSSSSSSTTTTTTTTKSIKSHYQSKDGYPVFVRSASDLAGPWTVNGTGIDFIFPEGSWATSCNGGNPAPFFFENGTVLMYFSANPCPPKWGNINPNNNCIGVARGNSYDGPFTALPLPITHPESEDAFVFRDPRGNFHLLTNVNNDHTRCAQGVECGGHAWSTDGITFSNLTIGAFGPVIRFVNGSYWRNAYVERPQILQAEDGTPIAFYVGIGRTSYEDSATFAQLFCVSGQENCGPTTPPTPITNVQYQLVGDSNRCLGTNTTFPCPGGWNSSCPVFITQCTDTSSFWIEYDDMSGKIESKLHQGICLNIDCNSCSEHTVAKIIDCGSASGISFLSNENSLHVSSCNGMCLDYGNSGNPNPPCKAGEEYIQTQITLSSCSNTASTNVWKRIVV